MSEDRDELRRLLDRFLARWNAGDIQGMSACWVEAGDVVSREGRLVRGRDAVAELLGEQWTGPFSGTRASMIPTSIRLLASGVALVDADMDIVSGRASAGDEPLRMHVVIVATQREDGWWFEAVRPYPIHSIATRSPAAPPSNNQTDETPP